MAFVVERNGTSPTNSDSDSDVICLDDDEDEKKSQATKTDKSSVVLCDEG